MLKNSKNKGITLIALVVTIIVMLILAAISITMITGDNSILKRAGEAKNRTELSSLKEEAQMVMLNRVTEKTTSGSNTKTLKEDLESEISNATVENINATEESEGLTDVYYVSKNGQYVTVYKDGDIEDGKVEIWDGKTVSCPEFKKEKNIWNWYIYTPSQLKFLADFVNNGNKLEGRDDLKKLVEDAKYDMSTVTMTTDTTIYLMNNLDLGARQTNGTRIVGKEWIPIGTDYNNVKEKLGTFEGNGYSIRGIYVSNSENYNGLFGNSNSIQNLTIKDSYIEGKYYVGCITGWTFAKIENCNNINTKVTGTGYIGGVLGGSNNSIIDCNNSGEVAGVGFVGGIIGTVGKNTQIEKCNNSGSINVTVQFVGGIAGQIGSNTSIKQCSNKGTITGKECGGIAGILFGTAEKCNNIGTINGKEENIGGIIGESGSGSKISMCNNSGLIITEGLGVGGIVGYSLGDTEKCINNGNIKVMENNIYHIGGIVGSTQDVCKINNNYNSGVILIEKDNVSIIGGILGGMYSNDREGGEIKYNYSIGEIKITGTGVTYVGGAIGKAPSEKIKNNYYLEGKSNVELNNLAEVKSSANMKTEEFLGELNGPQNPKVWEFRIGENSGYPVFIKTEE